jgi:hypothetical protein
MTSSENPAFIGPWGLPRTEALTRTIESTYRLFARYGAPKKLRAPEYREPENLLHALTAVPLRELDERTLGPYSGRAMTTVDGPDTYRHFLPRILELGLEHGTHMGFEPWVIAGKLDCGNWRTWPNEEQDVIAHFFYVAWECTLADAHSDHDWFLGIVRAGLDVDRALQYWQESESPGALIKCAHMIGFDLGRTDGGVILEGPYWDEADIGLRKRLTSWLLAPEMRARFVAKIAEFAPETEEHWMLMQGIATWDRLVTVPNSSPV